MKTSSLAVAFLLAASELAPVSAAVAAFDFDRPAPAAQASAAPRFEPDCADVVFQPEDKPVSEPVNLSSVEWVDECLPMGERNESCWERPGRRETATVRLSIEGRKPLLPWEKDVFSVCLTGTLLQTTVVSAAYDYRIVSDGDDDWNVVVAPGAKLVTPPDPRGVQLVLTPALTLAVHDQWAAYYPGGTVVLRIELKKDVRFWPDATLVERTATMPVAPDAVVDLGAVAAEPGGAYYATYSVQRVGGKVSTEDWTPVLRTQDVSYDPAAK